MCALTALECLDRFYSYSVLKSLPAIGQCLVNMNILPPKFRAHEMDPKTQNCDLRARERREEEAQTFLNKFQ
jgi:hypothetical protein